MSSLLGAALLGEDSRLGVGDGGEFTALVSMVTLEVAPTLLHVDGDWPSRWVGSADSWLGVSWRPLKCITADCMKESSLGSAAGGDSLVSLNIADADGGSSASLNDSSWLP